MSESAQTLMGTERVNIEYKVLDNGSEKKISLPFVMAVLGDFSAQSKEKPNVEKRTFESINNKNFNEVLKKFKPRLEFDVKNHLTKEGGDLAVEMTFKSMKDFSPANIAQNVTGLNDLYKARKELVNLRSYLSRYREGGKSIDELLTEILKSPSLQKAVTTSPHPEENDITSTQGAA